MRAKKEIIELTEKAKAVKWPTPKDQTFVRYEAALESILKANDIPHRNMDFDEYTGHFYWKEERSIELGDDADERCVLSRMFIIDPQKPLVDEIARVEEERKRFNGEAIRLGRRHFADKKANST